METSRALSLDTPVLPPKSEPTAAEVTAGQDDPADSPVEGKAPSPQPQPAQQHLPPPQPAVASGRATLPVHLRVKGPKRKPLSDEELLHTFDEFLYHGEIRDFLKAQHSFERISSSLGTEDFDALIPPCLEVLEFSNQFIRNDTLLCLLYISLGCTLCDVPSEHLAAAMRRHAAILAKHDAMPMFVRSLDFLLGCDAERSIAEEGMLEREFRLIFNCIYLQLLFNEHDEGFVKSLELGQGRLGASLVSLLFEATKMCADNDKIPIKKVILLLLRVLQCILDVPDSVLYPMPNPPPAPSRFEQATIQEPQIREFQAFTALIVHERNMWQKYNAFGRPAAIEEGLQIIQRYKDDFIMNYSFHPSEITFMQTAPLLRHAYIRYEQLRAKAASRAPRAATAPAPYLPDADEVEEWGSQASPATLGVIAGQASGLAGQDLLEVSASGAGPQEHESSRTGRDEDSDSNESFVSSSARSASSTSAASSASRGTVIHASDGSGHGSSEEDPASTCASADDAGAVPSRSSTKQRDEKQSRQAGAGLDLKDSSENRSPTAVFQRLYIAIFPRLTETVVLLLRLLLTSCSNVENYPGVIDMSRERHATAIPDDGTDRQLLAPFEKAMPSDAAETHRHREIVAAAVSGVILILLKQARRSVAEQFSSLAQLITDSNGALVVLKFLNQDLSSAMEPRDPSPVMACLQGRRVSPDTWIPSWPACATLRLVEVLYLLCKDSPERVRKYLIHYKAPFILKRLHRIENQQVQALVLKLLKKQVRYLPRKWKQANMKSISAIYSLVQMPPLEDWLLNEPIGEPCTEGPSQADIRASNVVYNAALLRHLSSGPARPAGLQPTSLEGHAVTMQPPRADVRCMSPRAAAAASGAAAAAGSGGASGASAMNQNSCGDSAQAEGYHAQGVSSAACSGNLEGAPPPPWESGACASGLSAAGLPHGCNSNVVVGGPTVRAAALALASLPGLSLCPVVMWPGAAVPGPADLLSEEMGDEVLGYARMFPEYVPAGYG